MKNLYLSLMMLIVSILYQSSAWSWQGVPTVKPTQAPMRTISLPAGWDAKQWSQQQQLPNYQLQSGQDGRQHLNFRADDSQWQQLNQQCKGAGSGAANMGPQCAVDSCQGVRSNHGVAAQQWLTPKAPDLEAALAGQPQNCPDNLQSQPYQGQFPSNVDPACWNLQQLLPCQSEETPGEYLQPHWRPNLLLVTLPAGGESAAALAQRTGLSLLNETVLKSTGDRLALLLRVDQGTALDDWVLTLESDSNTLDVQKEYAYFTMADEGDPLSGFNYGPGLTGSDRLLAQYDGALVRVAVIDTGIDLTHPELSDSVADQRDFTDKGYSADAHGTAVAAIIAAARNNGIGAAGVAPGVKISSYKACHPRQPGGLAAQCWSSSIIKALDEAIDQNIPLINMSLGGPPSPLLKRLLDVAEQRGLLVLAAAGNGGPNARPVYPAALPQSLAVTAVDPQRRLYGMANRGSYISVAAPGVDIITAGLEGGQPILSGTSMATAHATGVAALLLQVNPELTATDIAVLLESTSDDLGAAGVDSEFGAGLLNACRSASQIADVTGLCGGAL
ncbi:MAG: S8 family serine peptidase [Motiliproteus sp.]